ncbi:MAG: hypothetical protein CME65_03685 [Halobacteriovoraceae bacterium]|nr:hypothetical protein [Halobacteriovoraceae bacterium]|tara:strand:+ start:1097 stop:1738 length:642 start_codon:yes stop_codon:yes gene_type:complete
MQVKKVCLSIALLIIALNSFAQMSDDGCINCGHEFRGMPSNTTGVEELAAAIDPTISDLADQICNAMVLYDSTGVGPVHEAFELIILNHLGIDKNTTPNYRAQMREFWNEHHEQMICRSEVQGYENPQHILKRVVEMRNTTTFYFDYFLADRDINVNAVEFRNGQPETIVDYIDTILQDPQADQLYDVQEVRRLRSFLVEFMGAKTGMEILNT